MADPVPHALESATIDLLVGSDYFWHIIGGDRIMLPSGIFMLPSRFGYIITGRCPELKSDKQDSRFCTMLVTTRLNQMASDEAFYCSVNVSLVKNPNLERFWYLETIGITDPVGRESDDEVLEMFCKTIKFKDGRYQVAWPWKSEKVCVSDNYDVALRRMQALVQRFQSDEYLLQSYDSIIRQQLNQGIIERVDDIMSAVCTKKFYLPHHLVLTPNKATTKIRIVYNASSKAGSSMNSLNECLNRGPVILPHLCGLLIRFRIYPVVVLADIEKAFLQVAIQEPEQDMTRFLWLKDSTNLDVTNNLITYRFCRVPFRLI